MNRFQFKALLPDVFCRRTWEVSSVTTPLCSWVPYPSLLEMNPSLKNWILEVFLGKFFFEKTNCGPNFEKQTVWFCESNCMILWLQWFCEFVCGTRNCSTRTSQWKKAHGWKRSLQWCPKWFILFYFFRILGRWATIYCCLLPANYLWDYLRYWILKNYYVFAPTLPKCIITKKQLQTPWSKAWAGGKGD